MIHRKMHRLIDEIEKRRKQGQIIHFLTGDGIGDNMFYGMREGILSVPDTLKRYYIADGDFDCFVHIANSNDNLKCCRAEKGKLVDCNFSELVPAATTKSVLKDKSGGKSKKTESEQQGETVARGAADNIKTVVNHLDKMISDGNTRILIFLENLEWIANLHDTPENLLIARMQLWQNAKNLLLVATIKDMELLQKYHFDQRETFIGNPNAEEIGYAYLRYLLRNTSPNYRLDMKVLDDIAQSMSVGKKTLSACMRILRAVLKKNPTELRVKDFDDSVEKMIEEKVSWEKVRLNSETKQRIKSFVADFMDSKDKKRPLKGLILTGPPGTGKTLIAKALANETKCYFMSPTLADLKGAYVGQSSKNVKRVFAEARGNAPTILFIDEADTVFPSRALGSGNKDSYTDEMVNQFLQEIDGAQTGEQKIFTIAATNRPESIDPAVKSRLSKDPIEIPLPNKDMRRLIFDDNLSLGDETFTLNGKFFEDKVLSKSDSMSGRDIANFVSKLKSVADRQRMKLGNDAATELLFDQMFSDRERAFLDELTNLGVFARENIASPHDNRLKLSDIIGYDDLKEKILYQVDYIRASRAQKRRYEEFKIAPQKGVLMYGPPGNGKSVLAKAVAGEYGFYFFKVLSRDFANSYPEEQIKNLERIFTEVTRFSKMAACPGVVLFFDEFDSLAGNNILNPVVRGSLLNYISDENGLRSRDSKILFMAATNFEERLDDAIKRQGRIDAHLFMDDPTEANGRSMLQQFFDHDAKVEHVNEQLIRSAYDRLNAEKQRMKGSRPSGAELEMLYKELKEIAFRSMPPDTKILIINHAVLARRFPSA